MASGRDSSDGNCFENESNGGGGLRNTQDFSAANADERGGSGASGNNANSNNENTCRDFLNNVCFRGSRCKYYHPPEMGVSNEPKKEDFKFCNDYQNRGCVRENCRYVHCTRDDVDDYETSGRMSERLAKAIVAVTGQEQVAGRPLCKEYLSGNCSRGGRCRFWHINPREERERRLMEMSSGGGGGGGGGHGGSRGSRYNSGGGGGYNGPFPPQDGGGPASRRGGSESSYWSFTSNRDPPAFGSSMSSYLDPFDVAHRELKRARYDHDRMPSGGLIIHQRSMSPTAYMAVLEDNAALRRKIDMLKQTLNDVTSSNDTLIAENARLRAQTATKAAAVTDQAIAAASMASAAAINSVLSSSVAGLNPQALIAPAGSGLTTAEHLAVVSLAAAGQQPMVVQPSLEAEGMRWSFSQMSR